MRTPTSRLWELKHKSRCLETRRHLHLPNPRSGLEAARGEGRKGSAAWIALITPEIAAQKLQTQKEKNHFHLWPRSRVAGKHVFIYLGVTNKQAQSTVLTGSGCWEEAKFHISFYRSIC